MHGIVLPIHLVRPPVHPAARRQLVVEVGRKGERLVTEHLRRQQVERLPLLGRIHHDERRPGVGVALVAAGAAQPAHEAGGVVHGAAMRGEQHPEGLPHPLVAAARAILLAGGHPLDESRHQLGHELGAGPGELDRVAAQVEAVGKGIGISPLRVFVGRVGEFGLAAAAGDLFQLLPLPLGAAARQGFVAVFDRPEVIGAEVGGVVVALRFSLGHDVDGDVVHHARAAAGLAGLGGVVQVAERPKGAALEVVTQAERVPDLVHRHERQPLHHELLLLLLRESAGRVGRQCGRGQGGLAGMAVEQRAAGAAARAAVAGQGRKSRASTGQRRDRLGREGLVLPPPKLEEVGVEDDVGVKDLARPGVDPRRPHREPLPCRDPAEGVVVDVFRIPLGHLGLLPDLDRARKARLLEGLVPGLDAGPDRRPVAERNRLLDPEHDRLLRRRYRGLGIGLLELPAVDVADESVLIDLLGEVLERRHEVADAVVGEPRGVGVLRQQADRVADVDRHAPAVGHGVDRGRATRAVGGRHLEFDVVGKHLDAAPGRTVTGEGEAGEQGRDPRQVGEEHGREVDQMAPAGAAALDRQAEQDAVGVGEVDRLLLGAALGREEPDVAAHHLDRLVHLAELPHPIVAEAQAHAPEQRPLADPAGDAREHEELLAEHGVGEFGMQFVVLTVEGDQTRQPRGVLEQRGRRHLIDRTIADHDAVVCRGARDADVPIDDVAEHAGDVALERIAIAAAARADGAQDIAGGKLVRRKLRGQLHRRAAVGGQQRDGAGRARQAAVEAPRRILVALAFERSATVRQEADVADRAETAAPAPRARLVLDQLIPRHLQRVVALDVLDRVVARVREQRIDRIHAVPAVAPAVAALGDVHVHPVVLADQAAVRRDLEIAHAGADPLRQHRSQRRHQRAGDDVARAEARDHRRRIDRIGETATRRDDADRPDEAVVLRHILHQRRVQQHRAQRHVERDVDGADQRHVDRPVVDLRRGTGQIDRHLVAGDGHRHSDREILAPRIGIVEKPVDVILGGIGAIRNGGDRLPHHALRIAHQRLARRQHRLEAILPDQLDVALGAEAACGDLGLDVADDHVGAADVLAQDAPHLLVAPPAFVQLDRLELQAFGIGIDGIDDAAAAGGERAQVQVVRGGEREADQLVTDEDRHADPDVGAVRRAVVGVVVHDHIAGQELVADFLHRADDAAHVARDRPELQRRADRTFTQLTAHRVEQRRAEILGFADDAGVRHARELVPHLEGDVLEGAGDHLGGHQINLRQGHSTGQQAIVRHGHQSTSRSFGPREPPPATANLTRAPAGCHSHRPVRRCRGAGSTSSPSGR